jgi:TIR domain-containing protein
LPGPKVFVSYCRKDEKALEQLQRFLRPLERDGLLSPWADTRIEGGAAWKTEIDQVLSGAAVAVLLISQDFLNSPFITEEELPRILEREAAGRMTVLPVFLSPSLVEDMGFPDPRTGGRTKVLLTKFQGYGAPDKPLSDLEWSARERIYTDLARRLRSLSGNGQAADVSARLLAPIAAPAAGPARAYELTVQLEERADALAATYHLPGLEPFASASVFWAEMKARVDLIHHALDTANNRTLLPRLGGSQDGWGETLFTLLFPQPDLLERIFRSVFGRTDGPRPNPVFGPVRLRVYAEDAHLSGLPWRLASCRREAS